MKQLMILLLVASLAPAALADDGNASTAANGQKGLFHLNSGETMCHGQWSFSSYFDKGFFQGYGSGPGDLDVDSQSLSAAIGYGVTNRFELSLMVPYFRFDADERGDAEGLGNIRLGGKYQFKRTQTYVMAFTAFVDAPTGDDDDGIVTGETGLGAGIAWSNRAGWVIDASYQMPGDHDLFDVSDEVHVGVGYARDLGERTQWISELSGVFYTDGDSGADDGAELASGVRHRFSNNPDWAVNAALRVDLADNASDSVGGLVGISYAPRNRFMLTIDKPIARGADGREYPGIGLVRSADTHIDCGEVCMAKYRCGESATLTAEADATSRFVGWSGDCGGDQGEVTVTVHDHDLTCGATFIRQYDVKAEVGFKRHPDEGLVDGAGTLTVSYTGGPGTGSKDCATPSCTSVTDRVDGGASVTFTAKPQGKSTFEWTGDCSGTSPTVTATATKDLSCGVTFVGPPPVKADFELLVRGSGMGSVTFEPKSRDGVSSCAGDCVVRYIGIEAVQVAMTAVPGAASRFAGWSGACAGSDPKQNVSMDMNKTCVATFESTDRDALAANSLCAAGKSTDLANCEPRTEAILFPAGSNVLGRDYLPGRSKTPKNKALCEIAATLARCPEINACIVGSTDNQGGLAQERGQAVVRFLGFQNRFPYFQGVEPGRYKVQENCGTGPAGEGVGATVVLEKKSGM